MINIYVLNLVFIFVIYSFYNFPHVDTCRFAVITLKTLFPSLLHFRWILQSEPPGEPQNSVFCFLPLYHTVFVSLS